MIEITHSQTGETKSFPDKQGVADFLQSAPQPDAWEGYQRHGKLPEPTNAKPPEPKHPEVAVDDGARADESAGRHLVDPVESEDASADAEKTEKPAQKVVAKRGPKPGAKAAAKSASATKGRK